MAQPARDPWTITSRGISKCENSLFALKMAYWEFESPYSATILKLSWIAIYLMVACLAWSTKSPTCLNGCEEFLSNVKLKSNVILPIGKAIPPSM